MNTETQIEDIKEIKRLEQKARRAAKRIGLTAHKSRTGWHCNNLGGFMLVNSSNTTIVNSGFR
jgi:hypothetical protein